MGSASSDTMVPEEDFLMTPVDQENDLSTAPALTMAELEDTLDGASDAEIFAGLAMLQMVVDHPEEAHNSPELAKLSKSHFKWIKKSAQGLAKQISMSKDEEGADLMQEQWGAVKRAWNWAKNKAKKVCRSSVDKAAWFPKAAIALKVGCNVGCNWAVHATNRALARHTGYGELELLQAPEEDTDLVQEQWGRRRRSRRRRRRRRRSKGSSHWKTKELANFLCSKI